MNAKPLDLTRTALGIELGSTRIKAVLIDQDFSPCATGSYSWENRLDNGIWTYSLDDIRQGLQGCYRALAADFKEKYAMPLTTTGTIGISGMMHGYMPFDAQGRLLTAFRTWRNTCTAQASKELTQLLEFNLPQRWSVTHLYQAILDHSPHVARIAFLTTLSGYIHWKLTGKHVLGIGDASGMFPVDFQRKAYRTDLMERFTHRVRQLGYDISLPALLPDVLTAGEAAGLLTEEGARFLDPSGTLRPGIPLCPPEGDAGTGMVFSNTVSPNTGNISAGTSIFAMFTLARPTDRVYPEIDIVATPEGSPVAMVHCNNCTCDIDRWSHLFVQFSRMLGLHISREELLPLLFRTALDGEADCGGLVSYNYLSGEHIIGLEKGCPMLLYGPDSRLTLSNFMRMHLFSALATLRIGIDIISHEQLSVERLVGHGGFFKTPQVGQTCVANALNIPVTVFTNASEGGAWGMALLASYYRNRKPDESLSQFLAQRVFSRFSKTTVYPDAEQVRGFQKYLNRFKAGLSLQYAASSLFEGREQSPSL